MIGIVMLTIIALILATPFLLDRETIRIEVAKRLSDWTDGTINIKGPIKIRYFPDVTVKAAEVDFNKLPQLRNIVHVSTKQLSAELSWWSLLMGDPQIDKLILDSPRFIFPEQRVKEQNHTSGLRKDHPPVLKALKQATINKFIIRKGVAIIGNPESRHNAIQNIQADITFSRGKNTTSGEGTLFWRGKKLNFDLDAGSPKWSANTANLPIKLNLEGKLVTSSLNGEITVAEGFRLTGTHELKIANLRHVMNWLGVGVPSGHSLSNFKASGDLIVNRSQITFNNAKFDLDGNSAVGALAIDYTKERPTLDGTLDFEKLVLTQYLKKNELKGGVSQPLTNYIESVDLSLLQFFDADIRVSSGKVLMHSFKTGRAAVSLSLKSHKLLAEIAELELYDGLAAGRIEVDINTIRPQVVVNGTLSDILAERLFASISAASPLKGKADITLELMAEGPRITNILSSLDGKATISAKKGGRARLDIRKILAKAKAGQLRGWGKAANGETGFDQLDASFVVKNGEAHSQTFIVKSGPHLYSGHGTINLLRKTLDWRLLVTPSKPQTSTYRNDKEDGHIDLTMRGPWLSPIIAIDQGNDTPPSSKQDRAPIHMDQMDQKLPLNAGAQPG